jgi:hypothetical protein|tara:strand:+ start:532 stop:1083 length:552 start_codon:yes stop_codon:yes gene_type:complete
MITKRIKKVLLLIVLFFHIFGSTFVAYANGSLGAVLVDDVSGPYKVEVKSYAKKLPKGSAHFSIYVSETTKNENLDNLNVIYTAVSPNGQSLSPVMGYIEDPTSTLGIQDDRISYDSDILLDQIGIWKLNIIIDGPLGKTTVNTQVEIVSMVINWGLVAGILTIILLVLPMSIIWIRSIYRGG